MKKQMPDQPKKGGMPYWPSWVLVIVASIVLSLFLLMVYSPQTFNDNTRLWLDLNINIVVSLIYFLMIWRYATSLEQWLPWHKNPGTRFFLEFLGLIIIVFVVSTSAHLLYNILKQRTWEDAISRLSLESYVNSFYIPFIVTLFIEAKGFLNNWREALVRAEKMRFAALETRHSYLQNQIKPHFLFNSLNVLAALVHKDANLAEKFVHELSHLYRRLLELDQQELIPVAEEMKALESYVFLIQMRFGDALQVHFGDYHAEKENLIPPFTLQLLIENAVKHNEMTKDAPLHISLSFSTDTITVTNNLSEPKTTLEKSTGIGLKNLMERYKILSDYTIEIKKTKETFSVIVPLLNRYH